MTTPGLLTSDEWIDLHAHVAGVASIGVDATQYGVRQGVGVLIDAGSAPPLELEDRLEVVNHGATTVLAWANICAEGIAGRGCETHDISGAAARSALRALPGQVVGIKLQASNTRLAGRGLRAIENREGRCGRIRGAVARSRRQRAADDPGGGRRASPGRHHHPFRARKTGRGAERGWQAPCGPARGPRPGRPFRRWPRGRELQLAGDGTAGERGLLAGHDQH